MRQMSFVLSEVGAVIPAPRASSGHASEARADLAGNIFEFTRCGQRLRCTFTSHPKEGESANACFPDDAAKAFDAVGA